MMILLVNHYAGVGEMEHRPFYLAREWVRNGHRVTIVAASFSHLRSRNPSVSDSMFRQHVGGVEYLWMKTPSYSGNGLGRVVNIFTFVAQLARAQSALAATYRPDVVIASSTHPFDIYPASHIARRVGGKLVFEVHDLWPQTLIEVGKLSAWHPVVVLMRHAERFAYRHSDRVVSILPNADGYMRQRGMAAEKFVHIPNGIDIEEWCGGGPGLPAEHQSAIRDLRQAQRFLVGYAGAHGVANALDTVLSAADKLQDENVAFVLVGRGPEKQRLREEASARRLTNIVFLSPVLRAQIPSFLCGMDALYIGLKDEPLFRFGVSPNKLMDYMMAAKPVIHAVNASNDLVSEAHCGFSVPAEDGGALAQAVRRMMATSAADREEMGRRGRAFVRLRHSYPVLAERFLASVS